MGVVDLPLPSPLLGLYSLGPRRGRRRGWRGVGEVGREELHGMMLHESASQLGL